MSFKCSKCGCGDLLDENYRPTEPITAKKTDKGIIYSDQPWRVIKVKPGPGFIRRKRICRNCGHIIWTREKIEFEELK